MDMPLQVSHWLAQPGTYQIDVTIGGALRETAGRWPDRVALVEGTGAADARSWTFAALLETAERVARALLSRFGPGSRIAVWSASRPEWVLLEFGAALAGVTLVTVNPAYGPGEVEFVLAQSRADGLFVEPAVRSRDLLGIARSVSGKLPGLGTVVSFDDWDTFVRSAARGPSEFPVVHPADPAQIQYTSGTTGFPKGALLTHRGLALNGRIYAETIGTGPDDVWVKSDAPVPHGRVRPGHAGCLADGRHPGPSARVSTPT